MLANPNGLFLDIRIALPTKPEAAPSLQWAFAGINKRVTNLHTGDVEATWNHELDSSSADPSSVIDKGILLPHPGPSEGGSLWDIVEGHIRSDRVLSWEAEFGSTFNKATQQTQGFQELWADVKLDASNPYMKPIWLVADAFNGAKLVGRIVRVGAWCQGMLKKTSSNTIVDRCRYQSKRDGFQRLNVLDPEHLLPLENYFQEEHEWREPISKGGFTWTCTASGTYMDEVMSTVSSGTSSGIMTNFNDHWTHQLPRPLSNGDQEAVHPDWPYPGLAKG